MNKALALTFLAATSVSAFAESIPVAFRTEATPDPSVVSQEIFWIADTRKMDEFLAKLDVAQVRAGAYESEMLPDTRGVWRDYAREAKHFAARNDFASAQQRLGQMLKLAAIYRGFGGLQNVVQGEEIRTLAGQTASQIGCTSRLDSPYLESSLADCLTLLARQIAADKGAARPHFHTGLIEAARLSYLRLAGGSAPLAALETDSPRQITSIRR